MKLLISACVFGQNVRWNGKNKTNREIQEWASKLGLELVPVCPEHELFNTPREPIRYEEREGEARAIMGKEDVTEKLEAKASEIRRRYKEVVGFIGIAKSPTCSHSAGIRKAGRFIKAPMHKDAPFPTAEINSLMTPRARMEFLNRIVKHITFQNTRDS